MQIFFRNVKDDFIRTAFTEVLQAYRPLHQFKIELKQQKIKSSTMQAQPVINGQSLLYGIHHYRIKLAVYIKDSQNLLLTDLPEDVLKGWFAHELGHVVDYTSNSRLGMILYGIRYLISDDFKKRTEHKADEIAIAHGFRQEIIKTKRFILEHDLVGDSYKQVMNRYYMSIADAEIWDHGHVPNAPNVDL